MTDQRRQLSELDELRQANPVSVADVAPKVSMSWRQAASLLEADDPSRPAGLAHRPPNRRLSSRTAYTGLVAAAACLVVVVVISLGAARPTSEDPTLESASESPPVNTLVVEPSAESAPTTTALPDTPQTSGPAATPETLPTSEVSPTSEPTSEASAPTIDGPFNPATDLLAVHLDFANTDDGVAAAAILEMAATLGLDPMMVVATASTESDAYVQPYLELMTTVWGDRWVDAGSDRQAKVQTAANRWLRHLDEEGHVWIAEGGVSDFTAEVLAEVGRLRPAIDTRSRIHVVQHISRNERETVPTAMELVKSRSDFLRIDDGNGANGTADLYQASSDFEDAALSGNNSALWSAVFAYRPAAELDFSDTVTVLHIVGVGVDQVADPAEFAAYFME